MRPIWTGSLSFGLVNIPVKLYSATSGTKLEFDMLHKKDMSPIRYARVCRKDGEEVPFDQIVKGYEYQKGDYVILTEDDFKKVAAKKTRTIDILDFAKEEEIDPIYFEKPYYLEPDKGAEKAYILLRESLKKSKKVGIASFVMRNREHLAAIKPSGNAVILEQMRFKDELRSIDELKVPKGSTVEKREIEVALSLIDKLTEHFKPEDYKDTYQIDLKKAIDAKAKGKKIKVPKIKEPVETGVTDILKLLKASLQKQQKQKVRA